MTCKTFVIMMTGTLICLAGCTQQREVDTLNQRIARQDQQIQQFSQQLSGVQPAQADTWAQLQSLRQEMATVRGEIDNFNNATAAMGGLRGLAGRMERQQAALQTISTQFGMNLKLDDPIMPPDPTAAGNAAPDDDSGLSGATMSVAAPATAQPAPKPTPPPAANKDTATVLYDSGIASFNVRKYSQSFNAFRDFTDTYPNHKLVGNAWFWRGEANYQLGKFAAAALDYENVISKYPSNVKVASAYLKQGMSFYKTGKKDAARFRLEELIKKFPSSPEATRAKVVIKENT